MSYEPGLYEVISTVYIRREPKITLTNYVGTLSIGTRRQIFSVITDKNGFTWGRVSEADAAGVAQWVCIVNPNRQYMEKIPDVIENAKPLTDRVHNLEVWARTKGYQE